MEIEIIMQFVRAILECVEDRRRDSVEAGLLNPGRREYRGIVRMLRAEGLSGHELRSEASETFLMLREADAEDICLLVDEATILLAEGVPGEK